MNLDFVLKFVRMDFLTNYRTYIVGIAMALIGLGNMLVDSSNSTNLQDFINIVTNADRWQIIMNGLAIIFGRAALEKINTKVK